MKNNQATIDYLSVARSNGRWQVFRASGRAIMLRTLWLVMTMTLAALAQPAAAQYRGMAVGWPHRAGGNYAAYYPGNAVSGGTAYYVARPVIAAGNYGQVKYAPGGYTTYMPVTAAYANPAYTAGYGAPGYAAS